MAGNDRNCYFYCGISEESVPDKKMLVELWAAGGHGIFGRRHGGLDRRSGESPADISCASSYYMGLLLRQRMEEDLYGTAFRQYSVCMERHCR